MPTGGTSLPVALYHRVSSADQNPKLARREMRGAARARGFHVALDVEETGTGARNDRPGLQQVMEAARRGQVRAVVVWKLDRFGRSALDLLANIRALTDGGVRFIALTQGLDVKPHGDPMSQLITTVLSGVAEFERSLISERTRLGQAAARAAGKHIGRPFVEVTVAQLRQIQRARQRQPPTPWERIAGDLGISTGTVRRRHAEATRARGAA
jgi:putative DNA-invertase from lambdoid prophage Rac